MQIMYEDHRLHNFGPMYCKVVALCVTDFGFSVKLATVLEAYFFIEADESIDVLYPQK